MKNILTVIHKEFRGFIDSPATYIVIILFLVVWEFFFFRTVFLSGDASLRMLFEYLPWLFFLFIPALTMNSVSGERSDGTIELLLTHPLHVIHLILGKFLAILLFVATVLVFVFPLSWTMSFYGNLDFGVVFGQYVGALLMAGFFIALGLFLSSLFLNHIAALLSTIVVSFFFLIIGFEPIAAHLPLSFGFILEQLSVYKHFTAIARGVLDLRDVWFFIAITAIFLIFTYLKFLSWRHSSRRSVYIRRQLELSLLIVIICLFTVFIQQFNMRIDLTADKLYTLQDTTHTVLKNLSGDPVTITFYASGQLPVQFQSTVRDVKDLLEDYKLAGTGKIIIDYKDPTNNTTIQAEAKEHGIQEAQFNIVGQEEFQLKKGYVGIVISVGEEFEVIPFVQDSGNLEFQLTSAIVQLTKKDKKKIVFLDGFGQKNSAAEYRGFVQNLEKQFIVETVTLGAESKQTSFSDDTSVVVISGPTKEIDKSVRTALDQFIERGGSVLFLIDPIVLNPQVGLATLNENSFSDYLASFGLTLNNDLVYDLQSHENVNFGGSYILPYPLWPRASVTSKNSATSLLGNVDHVLIPWGSSLTFDSASSIKKDYTFEPLLISSKQSNHQSENYVILPDQEYVQTGLQSFTYGGLLVSDKSRIAVISDSDFLMDQFVLQSGGNMAFGLGLFSWLSSSESLSALSARNSQNRLLEFTNPMQVLSLKYGNFFIIIFVPLAFGVWRIVRRRNLRKRHYEN